MSENPQKMLTAISIKAHLGDSECNFCNEQQRGRWRAMQHEDGDRFVIQEWNRGPVVAFSDRKKKLVVATYEDFSWYFQQFLGLHCKNYEQMLLL